MVETTTIRTTEGELPIPKGMRNDTTHAFASKDEQPIRVMVHRNPGTGSFDEFFDKVKATTRRSKPAIVDLSARDISLPGVAVARCLSYHYKDAETFVYEVRVLFPLHGIFFSLDVTSMHDEKSRCDALVEAIARSFKPTQE